ncbi:cysteine proteinase [Hesseltinella vesiculosa]|uniref:Cysteine proteinase n=1 Tax=Hesseltinella vesiculosa TaxID=101127 RepID=A0A1X2GC53_9FUNG|nr:cysteine proteinase [Hesseltinella vesiculosa]
MTNTYPSYFCSTFTGNCFFRGRPKTHFSRSTLLPRANVVHFDPPPLLFLWHAAFGFAWFESLLHDPIRYQTDLARLKETPKLLERAGFQSLAYEDFYEVTLEQFERIPSYADDPDMLLVNFQSEEISNAIVMHLRFLASAFLRLHANDYEPFLVAEMISMDEFCAMHVEAFGRESDHLQIIALSKALNVPTQVVYLDGSQDDHAAVHEFWPDEDIKIDRPPFRLLYRPGHYDILYAST